MIPAVAWAGDSVYVRTLAGKKCLESQNQQIECTYTVGNDLKIVIAGIGLEHASITFQRSAFEGDFYGSISILHGCIIVKPGRKTIKTDKSMLGQYAFISPKNGKVYSDWSKCKAAQ